MSLINRDGDSLDCGNYVSDIFMTTQEFGGTVMMTISLKIVILPKGVYIIESHKKTKREQKLMPGPTYIYIYIYLISEQAIRQNTAPFIFKNSQTCPKSII